MNRLPFNTHMSPYTRKHVHGKDPVSLAAIGVPAEQWQKMSVMEKYRAILPNVASSAEAVKGVDMLDKMYPTPERVQFRDRVVYVPKAAGQASGPTMDMGHLMMWLVVGVVAGGMFYWTVK